MTLPAQFVINRASDEPFPVETFATLPEQQRRMEMALSRSKWIARSVKTLAKESDLDEEQVVEYCDESSHIAKASRVDDDGRAFYGHVQRLRQAYVNPSEAPEHEHDVFLSYAAGDSGVAGELRDGLAARGLRCFMAEKSLGAGDDWNAEIRSAVASSRMVLILVTPRSIERPWIHVEAGAAWALQKKIVPALIQVEPSDLTEPIRRSQARIVETLEQRTRLITELVAGNGARRSASARNVELDRIAQHILNYLNANAFTKVSFERIRKNINPDYSDDLLLRMIDQDPARFRRARLSGGRTGLALVGGGGT